MGWRIRRCKVRVPMIVGEDNLDYAVAELSGVGEKGPFLIASCGVECPMGLF